MVYAYIQDVPIGEELYRKIVDRARARSHFAGQLLHLCVRRPDGRFAIHRSLGVATGLQAGVRRSDSPRPSTRHSAVIEPSTEPEVQAPRCPARHRRAAGTELVMTRTADGRPVRCCSDPATPAQTTLQDQSPTPANGTAVHTVELGSCGYHHRRTTRPVSSPVRCSITAAVSLPLGGRPAIAVIGVVIAAAGAALALSGVVGVVRHHTTIVPHHPVTSLVTTGVYRISRNPMYARTGIRLPRRRSDRLDPGGPLCCFRSCYWPCSDFVDQTRRALSHRTFRAHVR